MHAWKESKDAKKLDCLDPCTAASSVMESPPLVPLHQHFPCDPSRLFMHLPLCDLTYQAKSQPGAGCAVDRVKALKLHPIRLLFIRIPTHYKLATC